MSSRKLLSLPEFVTLMASLTSLVALSIDAMLPALSQIGQDFGVTSAQQPYLIVSLFFVGMAIGQLLFGPISDARGRRIVILLGLLMFGFGTLICMFATTFNTLLIGRVVQAIGVAGPRVASLAVVRDLYHGEAMAKVMSFMMMIFVLMPMIAPLVGQVILTQGSWVHIFAFFLVYATLVCAWFFARQPETLAAEHRTQLSWSQIWTSCKFIVKQREVMGYTLASGFIFGAFLAYISTSQALFQTVYDTGDAFPFYFAILAMSVGLASFVNGKLVMRLGMKRLSHWSVRGYLLFSCILAMDSMYHQGVPPLTHFVCLLFATFFCVGILFGNVSAIAMQPLGKTAGLGAALINSLSGLLSVPIAIAIGQFIIDTVTPLSVGIIICSTMAIICMYFANKTSTK